MRRGAGEGLGATARTKHLLETEKLQQTRRANLDSRSATRQTVPSSSASRSFVRACESRSIDTRRWQATTDHDGGQAQQALAGCLLEAAAVMQVRTGCVLTSKFARAADEPDSWELCTLGEERQWRRRKRLRRCSRGDQQASPSSASSR
eukprot:177196-Hanusia_phi.AAC.1